MWFDKVPLFVILCGVASIAMMVPAIYGGVTEDHDAARPFLYAAIVLFALSTLLAMATRSMPVGNQTRGLLLSLVGAYLCLPVVLALPLVEAVPGLSYRNAYFEMVSSITTTGATVFDLPDHIPATVHLWRSIVGWLGGFLIWVAAIAILAPLRLGGFEVVLTSEQVGQDTKLGRAVTTARPIQRFWRYTLDLAPIYGLLTLALWLCLLIAGEEPFVAVCHAMATLSTSGISPVADLGDTQAGAIGEVIVFVFLIFALSRSMFAQDMPTPIIRRKYQDPELRLAATIVLAVPTIIFVHHWVAVLEVTSPVQFGGTIEAYWGAMFTTLSFLTTTGFISESWPEAQNWSGLTTPGLVLMGLALVGGGVATTAGGVKLLRVYALYKHGQLELSRLVHPSMIASPGNPARRIRWDSAYVAWLYFMIFALSVAFFMMMLSLFLVGFDEGVILTVAALTNTGPLSALAGDSPIKLAMLDTPAQIVLCIAMVLGRLETLAIIALLNPDFWRS
ncbi:hypothetical protein BV911_08520 [Pseudoruegeria sp. SK021]|nr:hypothetical protein BV911_08520 [Pseudoruegeria sp. SK021]